MTARLTMVPAWKGMSLRRRRWKRSTASTLHPSGRGHEEATGSRLQKGKPRRATGRPAAATQRRRNGFWNRARPRGPVGFAPGKGEVARGSQ